MNLNRFYKFENRKTSYDFEPSGIPKEDIIQIRFLMISNEGEMHER